MHVQYLDELHGVPNFSENVNSSTPPASFPWALTLVRHNAPYSSF